MAGWTGIGKDRFRWDGVLSETGEPQYDDDLAKKGYVDNALTSSSIFCSYAQAVTSGSDETSMVATGTGSVTLPADFLKEGRTIRLTAYGFIDTTGGNIVTFNFKLGSTTLTSLATGAYIAGAANRFWKVEALFTCFTTGSTGTVFPQTFVLNPNSAVSTRVSYEEVIGAVTIDTTTAQAIDLTATCTAATTITYCNNLIIEVLR